MKKTRLILLTVIALVLTTLLSACNSGGNVALNKLIDVDSDISEPVYNKLSKIDALTDAEYHGGSTYFALFTKHNKDKNTDTYKVLSLKTLEVVASFEYDDDHSFTVEFPINDAPVFTVVEEEKDEDPIYYLYDITGAKLATNSSYEPDAPEMFGSDVLIYDGTAYSVDKNTGKTTTMMELPEYLIPTDYDSVSCTDKYFVLTYTDEYIVVLDRSFNRVCSYNIPVAAAFKGEVSTHVLDNGNVLVQYTVELPADAKDYDIFMSDDEYPEGKKFDLVTILVDASNGKQKTLDLDVAIAYAVTGTVARDMDDSQLAESIENLAVILPIENKKLLADESDMRFMILGNDGSLKSAEFVDNQGYNLPSKIADNLFYLPTRDGAVLLDKDGKVVKALNNNDLDHEGAYFVGDIAIYDLELNSVYNFAKNDAELMSTVGGSVFVKEKTENGYKIVMLRAGEQKTVFSYDEDVNEDDEITFKTFGFVVYTAETEKYSYYSAAGDLIDSLDVELKYGFKTDDGKCYVFYTEVDDQVVYYTLTETAK